MNGIKDILLTMSVFGLLGQYANLLVLGTSTSKVSKELYLTLKRGYNLDVHNRPIDNFYDFIFTPLNFYGTTGIEHLLTRLRTGGIILVDAPDNIHFNVIGKYLQINKSYGLIKNERSY